MFKMERFLGNISCSVRGQWPRIMCDGIHYQIGGEDIFLDKIATSPNFNLLCMIDRR